MYQHDPIDPLAFDSSHPVRGAYPAAILGNIDTHDYELISLLEVPPDMEPRINARHLSLIGYIGFVHGKPQSRLAVLLDDDDMSALSAAYVGFVEKSTNPQLKCNA